MPPPPETALATDDGPPLSPRARATGFTVVVIALSVIGTWVSTYTVPQPIAGVPREAGIALWVVYGVSYLVLPIWLWRSAVWTRLLMNVWMNLLGAAILFMFWFTDVLVFLFSIAITAVTLPMVTAVTFNAVVLAVVYAVGVTIAKDEVSGADLAVLLSMAVSATAVGQLIRVVDQLRQTRAELAQLAVVEERNRLARDLHDVLGHSLTTISVKAALARRLLESDTGDKDRLVAEVSDSERLARQAMTEVRAVVSQYRASLGAELAGARQALDAAGIQAVLPASAETVPARLRPAFAHVLREGVTNVMRHSRAGRCEVRLGPNWIEVVDDGPTPTTITPGNGMTGLSERLALVGGTVTAALEPEGTGFRLRAFVPAGAR